MILPNDNFLLTNRLQELEVWQEFMEIYNTLMEFNVESALRELTRIRFLDPDADEALLSSTCRLLGFNLDEDVLNLSATKMMRLASQLGMYPDYNGTKLFARFTSMMLNGLVEVTDLYSETYKRFYPQPKGRMLEENGSWYKTTHVDVEVTFFNLTGLVLAEGKTLYDRVLEIFYDQCPITYVVRYLDFGIKVNIEDLYLGAYLLGNFEKTAVLYGGAPDITFKDNIAHGPSSAVLAQVAGCYGDPRYPYDPAIVLKCAKHIWRDVRPDITPNEESVLTYTYNAPSANTNRWLRFVATANCKITLNGSIIFNNVTKGDKKVAISAGANTIKIEMLSNKGSYPQPLVALALVDQNNNCLVRTNSTWETYLK